MGKIKTNLEGQAIDPRLLDERGPTPERLRHVRQSPINLMRETEKISVSQGLAAEKFYKHFHAGGMEVRIPSVDPDRVFGGDIFTNMPRSESEAFHRDRYRKAKAKIENEKGVLSFWVLEQVVCHEKPLTEVGAVFGHKNRTRAAQVAFDLLIPPLDLLVVEWGL